MKWWGGRGVGCFRGPCGGEGGPLCSLLGLPPEQPSAQFLEAVGRSGGRSQWSGSDNSGPQRLWKRVGGADPGCTVDEPCFS